MSEETKDQHQELKDNRHGIATVVGMVVFIGFGLGSRNDVLFGLVMATVYLIGMNISVRIPRKFEGSGRGNLTPARFVGALTFGIVVALVVASVLAIVDPLSIEGDNFITTIIKHLFDHTTSIALIIGALVGSVVYGMERE